MKTYHVAAASVALACPQKWLDNTLSKHVVPGVETERQGRARRISTDGLLLLAVVRALTTDLELSTARAIALASNIVASVDGNATTPSGVQVRLDLRALGRELAERIRDAVETTATPKRGRPPRVASRISASMP